MWYFTWVLGLGFAATLSVLNAMWLEHRIDHPATFPSQAKPPRPH